MEGAIHLTRSLRRGLVSLAFLVQGCILLSCGGSSDPPMVVVSISPGAVIVDTDSSVQFQAAVSGTFDTQISWSVNGITGGIASFGTISSRGLYTPPAVPPSPNTVTVSARSVVNPSGPGSASVTVVNPAPVLTTISPNQVNSGSPDTTLVVAGSGFAQQSVVEASGMALVTKIASSTQLTATLPATMLLNTGTLVVTVMTPSPGGGTSSPASVTVVNPAPVLTTISPNQVKSGSPDTTLVVTGSGFARQSAVEANGIGLATKIASSTQLTATLPASMLLNGGTLIVTVTTPGPGGGTSSAANLTVVNPAPVLTTISPNQVKSGSPDTTLVVAGSGFAQQSVVEASGMALVTKIASSTQLTATMLLNTGTLVVTVMTPSPGGGTSSAANLKVSAVVAVSPAAVAPLTGNTQQFTATVTGTSLQDVTWSIDGAASGNATVGTISATGLYVAPAVVPYPPAITVRAVSNFDNTVSGAANVTIASPAEDWPKFQRDLANTGRSIETGIGSSTVNLLQAKWKFNTGGAVVDSPAVATVNGVRMVFIGSGSGIFYALDADTGAVRWSFPVDLNGLCTVAAGCALPSSPAVQNGIVYFGTGNDDMYALNASDGSLRWKVRAGDPNNLGYAIWSSPAVYNGVVYVGRASHEACVPGEVLALDALTGTAVWTLNTACANGQCGGANVWAPPAIDPPPFGTLFIGTGDPNPDLSCTASGVPVATLYPETLLALDLNTGAVKSSFSAGSSTDVFDLDIGSAATLFETQSVDECTGLTQTSYWVEVASKNGRMYVLPRDISGIPGQPPQPIIVNPDTSTLISSPAAVPFTSSQPCGAGSSQIVTTETDLYEPSGAGNLFDFHMSLNGTLTTPWQLQVIPPCPSTNTFPCSMWSSPAAITDLLFFGANNNNVYAVTTGGSLVWSFATQNIVASSPAISHSALYFGSADGFVYCLTINGK